MELAGRAAIVTGGAGGLGGATVRRLVEVGMGVAVFDRDGDRATVLATELGDRTSAVAGDVNDDDAVAAAIEAAQALGTLAAGGERGGRRRGRWPHRRARRHPP